MSYRVDPRTGCWLWTGELRDGYGRIVICGRKLSAHCYFWERHHGRKLPPGVQLDHMCRRRACVRPVHLDPVLNGENFRRTGARYRRTLDRCPEGHRLDEWGIFTPEGGVICAACSEVPWPPSSGPVNASRP